MSTETPFRIHVDDAKLTALRHKLELTILPDEVEEAGWDQGVPLGEVRRLIGSWKDFDWRKHEAALNADLPQFTRDIPVEGHGVLNVHYVHRKSTNPDAIPLFFAHGWPGSFAEVRRVLPLLVDQSPQHASFNVVAISLPGFGFSEAPEKKGFGTNQFAEVGHKLMLALGYSEYVTHGSDWGALITRQMAMEYVKSVKALHATAAFGPQPSPIYFHKFLPLVLFIALPESTYKFLPPFMKLPSHERKGLSRCGSYLKTGTGMMLQQATQPQTLGYSLCDSPAGLLAWVYERLHRWTDDYPWSDEEILEWISLYYFSRAGPAASLRIYYEIVGPKGVTPSAMEKTPGNIPIGISFFPKEVVHIPSSWISALGNVVFRSIHTKGGHFAAHEVPEALAGDLRNMFGKGGPCLGVVPGRSGYKGESFQYTPITTSSSALVTSIYLLMVMVPLSYFVYTSGYIVEATDCFSRMASEWYY